MRVIDGLLARARKLGRAVGENVADSGQAVLYLRQLLRGNHGAPVTSRRAAGAPTDRGPGPPQEVAPATPTDPVGRRAGPPVLLIHGYLATRGSVHLLEQRLTERGHVVMTYRLGPVHMGDIRDSANFIARKVESLASQTGVERVDVVAHSMGGLVALDYLKRLDGGKRVRRLVLLGTPTLGTWSALLGIVTAPLGRASLQLLPGSKFLRDLEHLRLPEGPEVVTIAADRDWLAPPRTTELEGARRITLPTGHSGLLVDEIVAEAVSQILVAQNQVSDDGRRLFDGSREPN